MIESDTDRMWRVAWLRARYFSWKLGREVVPPTVDPREDNHWWHRPFKVKEDGRWVDLRGYV